MNIMPLPIAEEFALSALQIADEDTFHADWSPDGRWIAYGAMPSDNYDI